MENKILLIFFGWLLGLLAPVITTLILNSRKSETVKKGIRNELVELQYRAVLSAFVFHKDYGTFNHELLSWTKEHCSSYKGINEKEDLEKLINMAMEMSEETLQQYILSQRNENIGKSVKYLRTPFLESQLEEIGKFSPKEQTIILEILEHIKIHNDTVDEAKAYFSMTFDASVTGENRRIVNSSLNEKYKHLAERCRIIADKTDVFFNV